MLAMLCSFINFVSFTGCGSGLSGETLSENGHHWIGYDISQSMLGEYVYYLVTC